MLRELLPTGNMSGGGIPYAKCVISSNDDAYISTKSLTPLVFTSPDTPRPALWWNMHTRMLCVPYDNTMWLRYEALPLRSGRKSYDYTVLLSESTREGLLVGALDFDTWKNALVCSATDAYTLEARCGQADEGTHDTLPHGVVGGCEISSARFGVMYGCDYRELLEGYGDFLAHDGERLLWKGGVPFGFNSWAALAFSLNEERYERAGDYLCETLAPAGYGNGGVTYDNLDSGWDVMTPERLASQAERLHSRNQKAGIYDAPFAYFGSNLSEELPYLKGHPVSEILLRDSEGHLLPRVDGAVPYDVTHPLWKHMTEQKYRNFVKWGFDYVKVDFMTHGGMEGCHYDRKIQTGRQALNMGYSFINELLSEENVGRPFFISISIAPIFPFGYGHARRVSCDAFGSADDTEYELNSQTYGWWMSGRIYQYNDPDHIVLYKSFNSDRASTEGEAKARYTSAVIGGTVMMLSDNYEYDEARRRTEALSTNKEVNAVAASGIAFRPVESAGTGASRAYTAQINGKKYAALFHFESVRENVTLDISRAGLCGAEKFRDLWSGKEFAVTNGKLIWETDGCDALLLKEVTDK